jgi:L-ascorbate metabolism protein UlaG (beta-lactamase superfamily)
MKACGIQNRRKMSCLHHFESTTDILALPIQAPWGATTDAVELALRLKPKIIIPIHDWMWKEGFRQAMYERLQEYFKQKGIDFKPLETGETIDVKG